MIGGDYPSDECEKHKNIIKGEKIMKANLKKTLAAAAACAIAVGAVSFTTFAAEDASGTGDTSKYPESAEITAALGVGWNLGNQLEACSASGMPSETAWGNPTITQETLHMVKEAGFDSVRIPVSYFKKIGDADSGYKIDEAWLDRVQEVVDYAMNEDLYVVINMHGDGYYTMTQQGAWLLCAEEDQTEIKAKYEACWTQIAEKFKDYDEHLIFESMNEEFDGTYGTPDREAYGNINDYNQIFVDTVRSTGSVNSERWLLVPGWNTNIDQTVNTFGYVDPYGFVMPTDDNCTADSNRLMVSVHYYDPWNFAGDGDMNNNTWGSDEEKAYVDTQFKKLYDSFTSQGVPVIIGECGAVNKDNLESREAWYDTVVSTAIKYGCTPVVWDNNGHGTGGDKFGLFNRTTHEVTQPEIIDTIMTAQENNSFIGYPADDITSSEAPESSSAGSSSSAATSSVTSSAAASSAAPTSSAASSTSTASTASTTSSKSSSAASSSKAASSAAKDSSPNTGAHGGALAAIAIICAGAALTVVKKRK